MRWPLSIGLCATSIVLLARDTSKQPHPAMRLCPFVQQSRGADPTIKTEDYDPYLNPGPKTSLEV